MSTPEPPKRFYKEAGIFDDAAGFGVALDSRAVKTPLGADFRVPTRALGKACALEWGAQGERIQLTSMRLTQLAFASIDHTPRRRDELIAHTAKYGESDLVCHRADTPAALAKRQSVAWDALLEWSASAYAFAPPVVVGIVAAPVPPEMLASLSAHFATLDDFRLTALAHTANLAGSAVIALALTAGRIDGATAYAAATVDEIWSLETWGEDAEARARLTERQQEFEATGRFVAALA